MIKKLILTGIAGIAVLVVIGLVLPYFIPTNAYKEFLLWQVKSSLGYEAVVNGDTSVSFFPAKMVLENVTIPNPPRYGGTTPLMTARSMTLEVAMLPLLLGKINVEALELESPSIYLHRNERGIGNWLTPAATKKLSMTAPFHPQEKDGGKVLRPLPDILRDMDNASHMAPRRNPGPNNRRLASPEPTETEDEDLKAMKATLLLLEDTSFDNVAISDGNIVYDSELTKAHWDVQKLNIEMTMAGYNAPLGMKGSFDLNGEPVKLEGEISAISQLLLSQLTYARGTISSRLFSLDTSGSFAANVYTGRTTISSSSLKELQQWLTGAPHVPDPESPWALNTTGQLHCGLNYCEVLKMDFTLDAMKANGSIGYKPPSTNEHAQIGINFDGDKLDLDALFGKKPHEQASISLFSDAMAEEPSPRWSSAPIKLSLPQKTKLAVNVNAGSIVFHRMSTGKTTWTLEAEDGHLHSELTGIVYGGNGGMAVDMTRAGDGPLALQTQGNFKGVYLQPLLKDLAGTDRISGSGDIQFHLASSGNSEKDLISALSGDGQIKVNNGTFRGINLANVSHMAASAGLADSSSEHTAITDLSGSVKIAGGIISNHDLVMTTPSVHMSGQGTIDLPAYAIHYHLMPQLVQAAAEKDAEEKQGLAVPVNVEGDLDHPHFQPDLKAAARDALNDPKKFKEQLKNTDGVLKQKLKGLKNLLQGG